MSVSTNRELLVLCGTFLIEAVIRSILTEMTRPYRLCIRYLYHTPYLYKSQTSVPRGSYQVVARKTFKLANIINGSGTFHALAHRKIPPSHAAVKGL